MSNQNHIEWECNIEWFYAMTDTRFVRFNFEATSPATMTVQGWYEKQGWRKWLARMLRKPTGEWRDMDTTRIEGDKSGG